MRQVRARRPLQGALALVMCRGSHQPGAEQQEKGTPLLAYLSALSRWPMTSPSGPCTISWLSSCIAAGTAAGTLGSGLPSTPSSCRSKLM